MYYFRFAIVAISEAVITISLPYLPKSIALLLIIVIAIGFFDSIGYGTISQFASSFPPNCLVFVFMGQSITSILLLIITIGLEFGPYPSKNDVQIYFSYAAGFLI